MFTVLIIDALSSAALRATGLADGLRSITVPVYADVSALDIGH